MSATVDVNHWFVYFANFFVSDSITEGLTFQQSKRSMHDVGMYFWNEAYLYKVHLITS